MDATARIDIFERMKTDRLVELQRGTSAVDASPYFRPLDGGAGPTVAMDGRELVMLGSNNYLGLTLDPRVVAAAKRAIDDYGVGLTGSRLLNGTTALHTELEQELADWHGTESALVYTTGYQANLGVISAIAASGDSVVCDSANHASILDGVALSGANIRVFRHGRIDKLEAALKRAVRSGGGVLVIVDGVFSMEGDIADLAAITRLCERYGARLAVDEAHAVGVLGARGTGATELWGVEDRVDLRIGTFSKSLATCGGYVTGSTEAIDFLRMKSRSFLFTAASVPAAVGAALAAVRICRSEEGRERIAVMLDNARYLRVGLESLGLELAPLSPGPHGPLATPIVSALVGDESYVVAVWNALWREGVFVNVAMYPAVPHGAALLRLSVMASHSLEHLDRALEAIGRAMPTAKSRLAEMQGIDSLATAIASGDVPPAGTAAT